MSADDLRHQLCSSFPDKIANPDKLEFGYISPGHGARGKQRWIADDADLEDMYAEYGKGKKEVMLWFYATDSSVSRSRSRSPVRRKFPSSQKQGEKKTGGNYQNKLEEVESILKKLKEKHADRYPEEKLRAWAHLINMQKHVSYDDPPNLPFFRKGLKSSDDASGTTTKAISPGKKLQMRTQCIDQLDKAHSLLEKGGISQTQYNDLQEKILSDMKKF